MVGRILGFGGLGYTRATVPSRAEGQDVWGRLGLLGFGGFGVYGLEGVAGFSNPKTSKP